ncbi:unnamed protein product [Rhizophagus irregularis]|nr:unnamed protein product [Rhizophagus irregularis]
MSANPNERPTARELGNIFYFWSESIDGKRGEKGEFGYKGKEIKAAFEEADKEIPNISTSYEKNSDAIYTSRAFNFNISEESDEVNKSQLVKLGLALEQLELS